jgi:RNA polymerase sigma factor (sigma-70 family)
MEVQARMTEQPHVTKQPITPFQELFQTHYKQVVRQIIRITRDQSIAEDLAQDVFLKLYDQDIDEIDNVGGWLYQASLYAAYNYLRGEKRRLTRDEQQADTADVLAPSTEEHWLKQDEINAVRDTLTDLSERDRTLLLMKYSGYNYQELAEATELEAGSIGTLLARARRKFRDLYQRKRGE